MAFRIGCDVGGTFTDLCLFDDETGRSFFVKIPTTTGDQATAVIEAVRTALSAAGLRPGELDGFAHGTTVATNAILERKGARTALLVTKGFGDLLAIGRQTRPHLYNPYARRPTPLVPRHLVFEIEERCGPDGGVRIDLDEGSVRSALAQIREGEVGTVAIVFLHSYINPSHEQRAAEILRTEAPGLKVSVSSDVLCEPGEFERASTTATNAYLIPPLSDYLGRIARTLAEDGVKVEPAIMQSGGGVMPIATAGGMKAVHTCLSGPAAGMIGARRFAETAGFGNVVTIDMGGTSFDVGLIQKGEILTRHDGEIEGFPLRIPMFDIVTLGAGGGSIASIDAGGLLKVGPESAGAKPGPVAYGKGGERPTVTDANVVLGRLRHGRRISGDIALDRIAAERAIADHIAKPLALSAEQAAIGILQVVNAAMVRGMRRVTVERGLDPREFSVMAFGGAGPLHAVDLCAELGVRSLIIPPSPGLLCGIGLLLAPWKHEETVVVGRLASSLPESELEFIIAKLRERVLAQARHDKVDPSNIIALATLDMCYEGQGYQIPVSFDGRGLLAALEEFHAAHKRAFGYDRHDKQVEIRLLRLSGVAPNPNGKVPIAQFRSGEDPLITRSELYFDGKMIEVPVYDRARLMRGTTLSGPLIIEQQDTTVIVGGQQLRVDDFGSIIIEV